MIARRHALTAIAAALLAAGCAQVSHVATGQVTIRDRMLVTVTQPWNQFERGLSDNTVTWTQDGIAVDALRFYPGLKSGDLLAPTPSQPPGQKPLAFRSGMSPTEIVALFEALYSRDGSSFTLDKVAPHNFLGQGGYRFEFSSVRKSDDVRLSGTGWLAVRNGELYAMTFTAPRLSFYARHLPVATAVADSARAKN